MHESTTAKAADSSLASILRHHGEDYREQHALSPQTQRVMKAIQICRTQSLGGHVSLCNHCGKKEQHYNSCRNRHCPLCQAVTKAKWLEARQAELLPVGYFHVVFTIPHELNTLASSNPKLIYDLLFKAAWETIKTLGLDPRRLDGEMGMLSILHTWGQNLSKHIHIHCLVPGIALNKKLKRLKKSKPNYLFPVKVISKMFRGVYIRLLREAFEQNKVAFFGQSKELSHPVAFDVFLSNLTTKSWVVYSKEPFAGPEQVLKYIGRYTHKIAITNHRILSCNNGIVTFKWRDYKDENKEKIMKLEVNEFIRRFLQHVLPPGYVRIRHFGFMANCAREKKLALIRSYLGATKSLKPKSNTEDTIKAITGLDVNQCQHCGKGQRQTILVVPQPTDTRKPIYWDTS